MTWSLSEAGCMGDSPIQGKSLVVPTAHNADYPWRINAREETHTTFVESGHIKQFSAGSYQDQLVGCRRATSSHASLEIKVPQVLAGGIEIAGRTCDALASTYRSSNAVISPSSPTDHHHPHP
jgi:hypothetical protein